MASDAYTASEQKLAAAHKALLHTPGLQLDFAAAAKPPPPPGWLLRFLEFVGQFGPLVSIVFWGGLAVGGLLVVWFIYREIRAMQARRRPAAAPVAAGWRPEPEKARALMEEADHLAGAGRFDEAVHLLLFRSIDDIAGRRPGVVRPALTSRDIARLDGMPGVARDAFGRIAARVETSFFGGRPVSRQDFAAARGDYETFAFAEGWR
ncbi:hypothetical protein [Phenylobacterium sp.]|uniref:hypothetical protein n=1 Tax=Phenylobacterium sp. TaxID=1871053 RepID=UPI002F409344